MAPPHIMTLSPKKQLHVNRPGSVTKSILHQSLVSARVSKDKYTQPSLPSFAQSDINEVQLINQFWLHCQQQVASFETIDSVTGGPELDDEIHRRISYTKEQKLGAISYALTTWIPSPKDGSLKLIIKYSAAKNLGIRPQYFVNGWKISQKLKIWYAVSTKIDFILHVNPN